MSTSLTPPKAQIPIGTITINGVRYDVAQHPEFVRFFFDLMRRVGGASALSNTDLETALGTVSMSPAAVEPAQPNPDVAPPAQIFSTPEPYDARLQQLEAEVHWLRQRINDLAQGYQV